MTDEAARIRAQAATRIQSILTSEPGKRRPILASYIAFQTLVSAQDAVEILISSAEETPDAAAMWSRAAASVNRSMGFPE